MTDADPAGPGGATTAAVSKAPERAPMILATMILVAAVANLNLAVANVALPDIGVAFEASQTQLNLVAVGYSLGLASSVLYLGALGDRYGRKMMIVIGTSLAIPASILAAWAPSVEVLVAARIFGGLAAGMAFPTTLALITALWSGPARTKTIALWSGIGAAISALGPLSSGWVLEDFWWGSSFLLTLPLAAVALVLAIFVVPSHVNESSEPVDNVGGILAIFFIGLLVLSINFFPVQGEMALALGLGAAAVAAGIGFFFRQRRAPNPLYELHVAARPTFWVAAVGGIIVFGALMAAMFVGQQFLQNVLEYSTLGSGAAVLPAAVFLVMAAPVSARLVIARGGRFTLLLGYAICFLGFVFMYLFWEEGISYWQVAAGYSLVGLGVGFAATPASQALTGSVPVARAGMASATADLQRDLGGALMQSILGSVLTAGYAASLSQSIASAPDSDRISNSVQATLTKSFAGAESVAERYPQHSSEIIDAARTAFVSGQDWAYFAGGAAVLVGAAIVFFVFPKHEKELRLYEQYQRDDLVTRRRSVA